MCARFVLVLNEDGVGQLLHRKDIPREVLERLLQEGRAQEVMPSGRQAFASYNIAPTHRVPIVINRQGSRQLEMARWGYVPSWWNFAQKDGYPKFATFNARDDKLASSGTWKGALNRYRCMVPASGFYEWEKQGKERLPHYIHRRDEQLMAFAGLYSHYADPDTGESSGSFTIITTPSNRFMDRLHDRIPLVLGGIEDELWSVWLDPQTKFEQVEQHVASREWPEMAMRGVSTELNATGKARYVNETRLIEPVEEQGSF